MKGKIIKFQERIQFPNFSFFDILERDCISKTKRLFLLNFRSHLLFMLWTDGCWRSISFYIGLSKTCDGLGIKIKGNWILTTKYIFCLDRGERFLVPVAALLIQKMDQMLHVLPEWCQKADKWFEHVYMRKKKNNVEICPLTIKCCGPFIICSDWTDNLFPVNLLTQWKWYFIKLIYLGYN